MPEAIAFISHIIEDKDLAVGLREFIAASFSARVKVTASLDYAALAGTREWLAEAKKAIEAAQFVIVIAGPEAARRTETAFEAGAAWIKGVAVVVLCHGGVAPGKLPPPLGFLKAGSLFDAHRIAAVIDEIAKASGVETPRVDAAAFVERLTRGIAGGANFEILSATFGTGNQRPDVTIAVRRNVTKQGLQLLASNAILGTPASRGVLKELTIRYAIGGVEDTLVVKEGEIAMIRLRQ